MKKVFFAILLMLCSSPIVRADDYSCIAAYASATNENKTEKENVSKSDVKSSMEEKYSDLDTINQCKFSAAQSLLKPNNNTTTLFWIVSKGTKVEIVKLQPSISNLVADLRLFHHQHLTNDQVVCGYICY